MVITLGPELVTALNAQASRQGITPEALALEVLSQRFTTAQVEIREDWERRLRSVASDCGVSLSNEAVSSEGIHE